MAALSVGSLPWPREADRIDLRAVGFETESSVIREDALRARLARAQAAKHGGMWGQRALELANAIDPQLAPHVPLTLASSRHFREQRMRLLSEVFRLANKEEGGEFFRADVVKPGWGCDVFDLQNFNPRRALNEFRADLLRPPPANLRKGSATWSTARQTGFLFAAIHGEFDPSMNLYQPHIHVGGTGSYRNIVDQLRHRRSYQPTERVRTPVRITREIHDLPGAITYLLKSYWPQRPFLPLGSGGALKRPRTHQRIDEPFHTDMLLWINQWSIGDMILIMNLRASKSGLTEL